MIYVSPVQIVSTPRYGSPQHLGLGRVRLHLLGVYWTLTF
jgi:hypothetical protein